MKKFLRYLLTPFYVIVELVFLLFIGIGIGCRVLADNIHDLYWELDD